MSLKGKTQKWRFGGRSGLEGMSGFAGKEGRAFLLWIKKERVQPRSQEENRSGRARGRSGGRHPCGRGASSWRPELSFAPECLLPQTPLGSWQTRGSFPRCLPTIPWIGLCVPRLSTTPTGQEANRMEAVNKDGTKEEPKASLQSSESSV